MSEGADGRAGRNHGDVFSAPRIRNKLVRLKDSASEAGHGSVRVAFGEEAEFAVKEEKRKS